MAWSISRFPGCLSHHTHDGECCKNKQFLAGVLSPGVTQRRRRQIGLLTLQRFLQPNSCLRATHPTGRGKTNVGAGHSIEDARKSKERVLYQPFVLNYSVCGDEEDTCA